MRSRRYRWGCLYYTVQILKYAIHFESFQMENANLKSLNGHSEIIYNMAVDMYRWVNRQSIERREIPQENDIMGKGFTFTFLAAVIFPIGILNVIYDGYIAHTPLIMSDSYNSNWASFCV